MVNDLLFLTCFIYTYISNTGENFRIITCDSHNPQPIHILSFEQMEPMVFFVQGLVP